MSSQTGLKICLNSEIRKISKCPTDLKTLSETITLLFGANLPKRWALQYVDADEDTITISDELDFKEFLEDGTNLAKKVIKKVYIVSLPEQESSHREIEPQHQTKELKLQAAEIVEPKETLKEDLPHPVENEPLTKTVSEPKSPQRDDLDVEASEEQVLQSASKAKNQKSERRANKLVKKFAQPSSPKANQRLQGKLRELGKCLTAEQKEGLEKKKDQYLSHRAQRTEEFPTLNESQKKRIVHQDIRCDGCSQTPIVGIRYKCSKCPDFDYCEGCEARFEHHHPFIQMKKPEEKYAGSSSNLSRDQRSRQAERKWRAFPTGMQSFIATFDGQDDEEYDAPQLDENQHEKVAETIRRIYASEIQEKAQRLSEIFPERRPQEFYTFVSQAHHLSLEALIEKWLLA